MTSTPACCPVTRAMRWLQALLVVLEFAKPASKDDEFR
jgi:hypothetical protein